MNKFLALALFALTVGQASALSVSIAGGKKQIARTLDSSGNPIGFNDDKPWKVFELSSGTTEVQVTDESSVAPKQGILHKVCVESGTPGVSYSLVWDTSAPTGGAGVANRRLFPALYPATGASFTCTPDINALFTAGLRGANSAGGVITYIYWRGLGDRQ